MIINNEHSQVNLFQTQDMKPKNANPQTYHFNMQHDLEDANPQTSGRLGNVIKVPTFSAEAGLMKVNDNF